MRLATLVLGALLVACKTSTPPAPEVAPPPGELVRSEKPRLALTVPSSDTAQLTRDDADFAFDVLGRAAGHDNFFVSPHSMSIALAMTYAGARGNTATQMADALHYKLPADRRHPAFGALDLELARRANMPVESGQAFQLSVVVRRLREGPPR